MAQVLRHLPPVVHPDVLVDAATSDDAAVYRIAPDRVLIATVDFFTPIVDDPRAWGAIATANALSDVYAMGGKPLFALNLVGWPRDRLPLDLLGEVLAGAAEVAGRAGCPLLGGHSIDDPEPKFGMAVVGAAHPDRLLTNRDGRPGDLLVLTKPLGTGILTTALKRDLATEKELEEAVTSMVALNDGAAEAAIGHGVRAGTDVTGFGLVGHLGQLLRASGVGAVVTFDALPQLSRALDLARAGAIPAGTRRNLEAASEAGVTWDPTLDESERLLCADAQTSGGLLLAVAPDQLTGMLDALAAARTPARAVIGQLTTEPGLRIVRHADPT